VLLGLLVVFTMSRGGLLGLSAAVTFLLWLTPKRKHMVVCLIVFILLAFPFIGEKYTERMTTTITADEAERDLSSQSRLVLWRTGLLIFEDNPIFGVGVLNYSRAKVPYKSALMGAYSEKLLNYTFDDIAKFGHSTWICQLLDEGGLFLTVPYLWLIFGLFWGGLRIRRTRPPTQDTRDLHNLFCGLQAGIFGHCVCLSFIDGLLGIFLPVQLLVGMQIIRAIERESRNAPFETSAQPQRHAH